MPISLRLPPEIEARVAGYATRSGLTKSALIVRSIQEYLARHAQPTAQDIYEQAMQGVVAGSPCSPAIEQRPRKLRVREAIGRKHRERTERARPSKQRA